MTSAQEYLATAERFDAGKARPGASGVDPVEGELVERILEEVQREKESQSELWARMDGDYALFRNDPFQPYVGEAISSEDVYTGNEAHTLGMRLVTIVGLAERLVQIERDAETGIAAEVNEDAERLAIGMLRLADERRAGTGQHPLQVSGAFYGVVRGGWVAYRALLRKVPPDGRTVVDVQALDPRHLLLTFGEEEPETATVLGLRSRAAIRRRYGFDFEGEGFRGGGDRFGLAVDGTQQEEVVDHYYWMPGEDGQPVYMNCVIIASHRRFARWPYRLYSAHFPIIARAVGVNPGVASYDITGQQGTRAVPGIADFGESVFGPNRHIFPASNRVASIAQSLLAKANAQVKKVYSLDGTFSLEEAPEKAGQIALSVAQQQDVQFLDVPELSRNAQILLSFVNSQMVAGGIPPSAEGITQGAQSGRALTILNATLGDRAAPFALSVQSALLGVVNNLVDTYEMGDYQPLHVAGRGLDDQGFSRVITPDQIREHGPFTVRLTPVLPQDDETKWQIAAFMNQANPATGEPLVSTTYIRDRHLRLPDADLERRRIYAQMARTATPRMLLMTQLEAAIDSRDMPSIQYLIDQIRRLDEQEQMEDIARRMAFMQAFGQNPVQAAADGVQGGKGNGRGRQQARQGQRRQGPQQGMEPETMPLSGSPAGGPSRGAEDTGANAGIERPNRGGGREELERRAREIGLALG